MSKFKQELTKIKAFVFDIDGVFSSSKLQIHPSGEIIRTTNIKDGYAVQLAIKKGYKIAIITGGNSEAVRERFKGLGITDIYLRSSDKVTDFEDFIELYDIDPETILYMGDDMPDYNVMLRVGMPTCPADAASEIKGISKYISGVKGGEGCVRDVVEQVLRVHGDWMDVDAFHW